MESQALTELEDIWPGLSSDERLEGFRNLPRLVASEFYLKRSPRTQAMILKDCVTSEARVLFRLLQPDDAADVIQEVAEDGDMDSVHQWLGFLDDASRAEVQALLRYREDEAGGRMSPRYLSLAPGMGVDAAIRYIRRASQSLETVYYLYVVGDDGRLEGVLSLRELLAASADKTLRDLMHTDLVTVPETMDQEEVALAFAHADLLAIPVVDADGHMKGIVTFDDIADVMEEEATEDIHRIGGLSALDAPYLQTPVWTMVRKRAVWLVVLFVAQMLTASALGFFEADIANAVVLAIFLPLIISSGGNTGGQASTLIIRAMALGQVNLRDAGKVFWREARVGLLLGILLATLGSLRIFAWEGLFGAYGADWNLLAAAVGVSVVAVVMWGALAGSMLPLGLRRIGLDPATASAPFVATLVDVTGVVIYFTMARVILGSP